MIRSYVAAALSAVALSLAVAAPADARVRDYVAQLQSPLSEPKQIVVGELIWQCADSACRASAETAATVSDCRRLAERVGPFTGYGSTTAPYNADRLAQCNAAAPATQTAESAPAAQ